MRWLVLAVLISSHSYSVVSENANEGEPSLRIIPKSAIIDVGDKRAIYCEGTNLPDEQAFQWITPSGAVLASRSNRNTRVYLEKSKLKGNENTLMAALVISTASHEDSGNWTCKANELQDVIQVFVGVRMNLSDVVEAMQVDEGTNFHIDCVGQGDPVPSAQWYKNGVLIPNDSRKYRISVHTREHNTKLEVRNVNHMDSGEYACKLTQKLFMTFAEKKVMVSVKHKPILLDREGNEITSASIQEDYAILNEIKVLRCSSKAYPPAKYTWTRHSNSYDDLIEEDDFEKEPSKPMSVKSDPSGEFSDLILMMRDESYLGQYKCIAKNDKGEKQVIYDVTLGEKPPAPTSITLESANYTELLFNVTCLNCTFKDAEQQWSTLTVNAYHFQFVEYKEGFLPDWESDSKIDIEVKIEDSNDTLFWVGPLPNDTRLSVRVRSRNQAGASQWLLPALLVRTSRAAARAASLLLLAVALLFVSK